MPLVTPVASGRNHVTNYTTGSLSHLRTMLPENSSRPPLRSRVSEHLYRNAEWIPINSGYGPDTGGPQEQSFSFGSSRTGVAFFPKTSKNGHISVVVAPIGLIFCVRARFLVS